MNRLEQFSTYVAEAARAAGFDIDSPRGGGKKALAKAAGMSQPSVSRMLAGKAFPDRMLERIADALGVSLPTLLVESGVVTKRTALAGDQGKARTSEAQVLREAASKLQGLAQAAQASARIPGLYFAIGALHEMAAQLERGAES